MTSKCPFKKDDLVEAQPEAAQDPYARLVFAWEALSRKSQDYETVLPEAFDVHCLELVRRYITTLDRQYRNALLNLRQYRKDFVLPEPVSTPIAENVTRPIEPGNLPAPTPPPAQESASNPTETKGESPNPAPRNFVFPIATSKTRAIPPGNDVSRQELDPIRGRKTS